jgi:hypothetical protein
MQAATSHRVRKRRVFYIPGYDPFHPRRYRELYRKEAAAQAQISGYEIGLTPKPQGERYGWHVDACIEGAQVETDFEVLVWSDLVRDSMNQGILATYWQLARTAWVYITSGALWRLMRLRKGPVIAALYPVGALILQLLAALLVSMVLGAWLGAVHPAASWIGLVVIWPILAWFQKIDKKVFAYYLMHDYAYSSHLNGANPPLLDARLTDFRSAVSDALLSDADEVLLVGHSSGAHLAVHVLADMARNNELPENAAKLNFLSLGQVVPMMSFLPNAQKLRADLKLLSEQSRIFWLDVTAPGDGCAFALCDPVAVSGVAGEGKKWPLVISAAFTQTLSPERWKELRWRFFRLHFQYLCAFDAPGDYDYFRITAGPMTLSQRYFGRSPSKSRIEKAVSGYTSTKP